MGNISSVPEGAPLVDVDETLGRVLRAVQQVVDELLHLVQVLAVASQLVEDQVESCFLVVPVERVWLLVLLVGLGPQLLGPGQVAVVVGGLGQPRGAPHKLVVVSAPRANEKRK